MMSSVMSIPTAFEHVNTQGGIATEFEYDTKPENMHVLYYIARNQLYSDEILAVIREYACNGMDIHVKMGRPDLPIRVTLPTLIDSFLKIRDFGSGLNEDGIKGYVSFGESDKRSDPNQTGQLGIGCKSGFTYGDSFMVNSFLNGKLTVWNAYIDPSNKGKIAKMAESDTTEPDGIEVVIPIRASDVSKTHEKAMWFFSFWSVVPNFVNATVEDLTSLKVQQNKTPIFSGNGWKYFSGEDTSYVVMGNIPYPLDSSVFTDDEIRSETKELMKGGLVIQCKMDEVDFAASREQLKYTPKTKKAVAAKMTDVGNDLPAQCASTFTGCATLWDAKLLYRKVFDMGNNLYRIRGLFRSSLTCKGFKVNGDPFHVDILPTSQATDVVCHMYHQSYGTGRVRKETAQSIMPHEKHMVVVNDTHLVNGIMNRVVPLIMGPQGMQRVYVLTFADDNVRDAYLKTSGLDCALVPISTLPKEPLAKYFKDMGVTTGTPYRNSKHMSKEFTLTTSRPSGYGCPRSDYWQTAEVNLDSDEGVYIVIDKFQYADKLGRTDHPRHLLDFLEEVKAAGITLPSPIYGFKKASADKAKANPNMQSFWDWYKQEVAKHIDTKPDVAQELANYHYMHDEVSHWFADIITMMEFVVLKWKDMDDNHVLRDFALKLSALNKSNTGKVEKLYQLAQDTGYVLKQTPTYDLKDAFNALKARYPLMFKVMMNVSPYRVMDRSYGWSKLFTDYILLVDVVTP